MPEQNLTNLLNLPNLEVTGYEATDDEAVIVDVKPTLQVAVCPDCKKPSATLHDYDEPRLIRDLSLFGRKSYLRLRSRRFECEHCGSAFTERLEWIAFDSSYTRRFENSDIMNNIAWVMGVILEELGTPPSNRPHTD